MTNVAVAHLQVIVRFDQLTTYQVSHLSKRIFRVIYLFAIGIQEIRVGREVRAISRVALLSLVTW